MRTRARLGQGLPPQPDPSASTLSTWYGPPFSRFFPLLRPSGAFGTISRGTAGLLQAPPLPGGGGGGALPAPGSQASGLLTDLYPWLYAPVDATPFVLFQIANVAVAPAAVVNILTLPQLPRGRMGVIKRFGNSSSDVASARWAFLVRNQPVFPIGGAFFGQYGLLNDARPLPDPGVILNSGDDFVVQVTNVGAVGITVGAVVVGYQWTVRG